jgi:hypothetical protein
MAERDENAKDAKDELDPEGIEDLDVAEGEAAKVVGGLMSEPGATELLA